MQQWHHSGLEGYCKAAAQMMGLPDNNSGWGNFGRDLFADGRFDDPVKASKTWTLSRSRQQGRSNRPKIFEESWLGESGTDCELRAIHTCAHSMCSEDADSAIYELFQGIPAEFAADFHSIVLPAIEDGFATERYHPADIARFSLGIDKALGKLDPALPQTFRNFIIPLVAGLIYGPGHGVAQSATNSATLRPPHDTDDVAPFEIKMDSIGLTQVFDKSLGLVGHSGYFDEDTLVLLGRGTSIAPYLEACSPMFGDALDGLEPIVFPIAHTHKSVSKEHAAIARIGDTWYFYDFSANGSYVENDRQIATVHNRVVALSPGDRIFCGISKPDEDEAATYNLATALSVSFKIDEANL